MPLFTKNALDDDRIRSNAAINTAAIVSVLAVALVELVAPNGLLMAVVAGISALLVLVRSLHWGAFAALRRPILWVLHLGHAWIWFGLALKAAAAAGLPVPPSVATHAPHGRRDRHPHSGNDDPRDPGSHRKNDRGHAHDDPGFLSPSLRLPSCGSLAPGSVPISRRRVSWCRPYCGQLPSPSTFSATPGS